MKKESSRKYIQKTLQTSPAPTRTKETPEMVEEDSAISVRTLRNELRAYREGMLNDIKTQIESMYQDIRKDISSLREEAKADINTLRGELSLKIQELHKVHSETADTQREMERSLCDTSDRITAVEKAHETLKRDYDKLQEKCMDLENRGRRQNLRIVGITEDTEAGNPSRFAADFFVEVLGEENFDSPIIIDRAHRTLAPKPRRGERPRAIIVRLHHYSDKEKILRLSRCKGRLFYKGSPVHIFPDLSPEIGKLRASFNPVKVKLRNVGIPYSLYYPAKLVITVNNTRHSFTDPQESRGTAILINKTTPF
uniref:L1 transposable element RRM domain-containing protein n=1 Tax=Sphaeramia orbicularis TaxID=375764 RepID=A0A673BQ26_9TELE